MKIISGILLPAEDGAHPLPIPVTDLDSITKQVGGTIDAVTRKFQLGEFTEQADDAGAEFIAVGYVHDEGLVLDLPLNKLATLMFTREIRGPVVVVSGTNESGVYDGDNYDLPEWFCQAVYGGSLEGAVDELDSQAEMVRQAIVRAVSENLMSKSEATKLIAMMANVDLLKAEQHEKLVEIVDTLVDYHMARTLGMPPVPFDVEDDIQWSPSDEEIAEFLAENGGE